MLDIIQGLSSSNSTYGLNTLSSCNCSSNSESFNIVMESLLKAMKEAKQNLNSDDAQSTIEDVFNMMNSMNGINSNNIVDINTGSLNTDEKIENAIEKYSKKYGVDSNLIKSIIKAESNFDPNAVSEAGAQGLMQLMPEISKSLGVKNPFDIEQNIEGGVKHIKSYIDMYDGDIEMALMAYNGGPTRMLNRGVNSIEDIYKMPKETQNYVTKVMSYYRSL